MSTNYPPNYLIYNSQSTKQINVVVTIDGVPQAISLVQPFKTIKYGDPDLVYGGPGVVYGGLIQLTSAEAVPYLSIESNLTISQKVEPEQGRASVSTLTLVMIDKDQFISNLIAPGNVVDELLGNKLITVKLGYLDTSYPEDYFTVFRGYVTSIKYAGAKYSLQISDATTKQRAQLFYSGTANLNGDITNSQTNIPTVAPIANFYQPILGPDNTYDAAVTTYIVIDSEVMSYGPTGIGSSVFTVVRAQRGTTADTHSDQSDISNTIQIEENGIILALKLMLSGWDGPWISGVSILTIQDTMSAGLVPNYMIFDPSVDLFDLYGLTSGDYFTISGSGAGNNGTYQIKDFTSINGGNNNVIIATTNFPNPENPATSVQVSFRSQYDTLPILCGLKMTPREVDVAQYQSMRDNFFSQDQYKLRFYIQDRVVGKTFIESEIMLPFAAYDITRFGRISMTVAKPPIAGENLAILDKTNVLEPANISVERSINNRMYFNDIQYRWDYSDSKVFGQVMAVLDSDSLSKVDIDLVLPIESQGLRSDNGAVNAINARSRFLITRYRSGAILINLKTNWKVGSIIETGDVVLLNDNGGLQIANFVTGVRDLGSQLWEVTNRSYDIKSGTVTLSLLGGIGYQLTDRYGTISPSSLVVGSQSTTTKIKIKDSFGILFVGNEQEKWTPLIGSAIKVHSYDYTTYNHDTVLTGFDPADPYMMLVSPALPSAPLDNYIVDIADYPNDTDKNDQALQKLLFEHLDPSVTVVTGVSATAFTVGAGDIGKFTPGIAVLIHNSDYSILSPECVVDTIVGNQVNLKTSLGFTPSPGQTVEGIGFIDGGGFYRIL